MVENNLEIRVSNDVKNSLDRYIQRERILLDELLKSKKQRQDIGTELGKAILTEGAAVFAADLLESSRAGKYGREIAKSYLEQLHTRKQIYECAIACAQR